ncbi:homing endonuclease I-ApeI [Candidatus Caldarchaeum subterraneum]|uniref:Homing endonuclease I-ApeI n=1 Tax=Caldiarchaeum subterraneum TaxID=311458 RepID=E6PB86_CALS0|nr:homing endonuclease I-ApeI [Candidatus Caldarchaeum subterraneum]
MGAGGDRKVTPGILRAATIKAADIGSCRVSEDLYYLIGASCDAYMGCRRSKGEYVVEFYQKNLSWLCKEVVSRLQRLGFRPRCRVFRGRYYRVVVYSKKLYQLLSQDKLTLLEKGSETEMLWFVRGMVDAEGSVITSLHRITIWQNDVKLLEAVRRVLENHGLKCGKITRSRNVYALPIYGRGRMAQFMKHIGFRHPEKRRMMRRKVVLAQP